MCAAIDGIEGMGVRTRTGRCAMVMSISPGTVGAMLARHIDAPTMCRHLDRAGKADSGGNIRATIRSKAAQASPCQRAIMAACKRSGPARSPQAICGGGTAARSPDAMLCAGSWETPFKVAATTLSLSLRRHTLAPNRVGDSSTSAKDNHRSTNHRVVEPFTRARGSMGELQCLFTPQGCE